MQTETLTTRQRGTAAIVGMVVLIGGPTAFVMAQSISSPDTAPLPGSDEALYEAVERSAAIRLMAAMGPNTPIDTKVARLIDRLVLRDHQEVQAAVTALTMLGWPAVPSIIRRMDDRRLMPTRSISFVNPPNAFEGLGHYGVEKVVDCLDIVLNAITGEHFGQIDLGLSIHGPDPALWREHEAQRSATVAAWRKSLTCSQATPRTPKKSLPPPGFGGAPLRCSTSMH